MKFWNRTRYKHVNQNSTITAWLSNTKPFTMEKGWEYFAFAKCVEYSWNNFQDWKRSVTFVRWKEGETLSKFVAKIYAKMCWYNTRSFCGDLYLIKESKLNESRIWVKPCLRRFSVCERVEKTGEIVVLSAVALRCRKVIFEDETSK